MNTISSYSKIYTLGHPSVAKLFNDLVSVEEKIDGSQFSMGCYNGELFCRSKRKELILEAPEKLFTLAVETAIKLKPLLNEGWTYRCEYLRSKKHNVLDYSRHPQGHLIILDIDTGNQNYLPYDKKKQEADRLGLECAPLLFSGIIKSHDEISSFLDRESCLGGPKIEGVVIKSYNKFTDDAKAMMGKYVSEKFKEKHNNQWKATQPGTSNDILNELVLIFKSEARWEKAVQHLRDAGELTRTPKDIGSLMKEVIRDIKEEESEAIKTTLYDWAFKHITRRLTGGLPEWYKNKLMESQFQTNPTDGK